jgi:acetyl/propionyl-CoA carboxylase alpha subunit
VRAGSEVSIWYDSMLAKLIAYGPDRASAIATLEAGLADFRIEGVPSNLPLLLAIARDEAFRAGATTTGFLGERAEALRAASDAEPDAACLIALGAVLADPRAWRVGGIGIPVALNGAHREVRTLASRSGPGSGTWRLEGDFAGDVRFEAVDGRVVVHAPGGQRYGGRATLDSHGVAVEIAGATYRLLFAPAPSLETTGASGSAGAAGSITAPMPGKILKIAVAAGDAVSERDLLVVLEAMKMEHRIEATAGGTVKRIAVTPGALVASGATLLEIE